MGLNYLVMSLINSNPSEIKNSYLFRESVCHPTQFGFTSPFFLGESLHVCIEVAYQPDILSQTLSKEFKESLANYRLGWLMGQILPVATFCTSMG